MFLIKIFLILGLFMALGSPVFCESSQVEPFFVTIQKVELKNAAGEWVTVIEPDKRVDMTQDQATFSFFNNGRISPGNYNNVLVTIDPGNTQFTKAVNFEKPLAIGKGSFVSVSFILGFENSPSLTAENIKQIRVAVNDDERIVLSSDLQMLNFGKPLYKTKFFNEPSVEDMTKRAKSLDVDGDGISNYDDNCPGVYNPNQIDTDKNDFGDMRQREYICKNLLAADLNLDSVIDYKDMEAFKYQLGNCNPSGNMNVERYKNNVIDRADFDRDGCFTVRDMSVVEKFLHSFNSGLCENVAETES